MLVFYCKYYKSYCISFKYMLKYGQGGAVMDIRKFVLSYYSNATKEFHINEITHPKGALSLHTHDYFQIYYLKRGRIIHHLEGSAATLGVGDVFIIPPGLTHYIETASQNLLFYSISFTPDFLYEIESVSKLIKDFIAGLTEQSFDNIAPSFSLNSDDLVFVDILIQQIMSEFSAEKAGKDAVIKSAMSLLLSIFARSYLLERCESIKIRSNREAIMHSVAYLENHFAEHITLEEIARKTAMSKAAFCSAFHEVIGETFNKYLNRKRIENAARLIKSGKEISAAAQLCGYVDFSTFYRNFKKVFGISPTEYLRENAPEHH